MKSTCLSFSDYESNMYFPLILPNYLFKCSKNFQVHINPSPLTTCLTLTQYNTKWYKPLKNEFDRSKKENFTLYIILILTIFQFTKKNN